LRGKCLWYLADMGEKFSLAAEKVFGGKEGVDIS
jgi:hypothetical protein